MAGQISKFRLFLHKISEELGTEELENLKFLCTDILTKARLEKIKNTKELFVAVGEVTEGEEKQLDLLKQLFKSIYRLDLESQVETFQQSRKGDINQHAQYVDADNIVNNTRAPAPLQHTLNNHKVVPNSQNEVPSTHPGSSVWLPQGSFQQATESLPPYIHQTGLLSLNDNAGFQQDTDSLLNAAKYRQSSLAPTPNSSIGKPSSGGLLSHTSRHAGYSATDAVPSYPVQHSLVPTVNLAALIQPGSTANTEEQLKHPTEQESALKYQSQQSVPFGQQEQSYHVNKEEEDTQWKDVHLHDKIELVRLPVPPQSSPKDVHFDDKIELVHLPDPLQSSPDSFSMVSTQHEEVPPHDKINPESLLVPLQSLSNSLNVTMEANQGTFGDSGQGDAQNSGTASDNRDSGLRGRSWTDGSTANTGSDQNHRISQPCAEKVPVERVMSNNYDAKAAQHLHKKCPVEMSYDCISTYFDSGGKNLGKGGFGIVYEGIRTFHGQSVVVKEEYRAHLGQAHSAAQLQREKRVGYIKHPHLMPLYACCEEKGKPRCLMYPKMHSDLHKALRRDLNGQQRLPWEDRVRIALHTARALLYLHTEVTNERNVRQEIVHMDVKPGNIFLDEDFNARLGDPGMAQELPMEFSYASISQIRGTEGYMDEYLQDRHFKPVNDIFSFGVVLLQLLTQRKAVERSLPKKDVPLCRILKREGVLSDPERLMEKAQQGVWPDSGDDKKYTKEFASIAIECLKQPVERAKLTDVCQRLEEILERKGVNKVSRPKEGAHCMSCLLNCPAKYLGVRSPGCDSDITQECSYFCVTCLTQARRNPLECPSHGPAEPPIGGSDIYAVLVCGNDPYSRKAAAVFERDLLGFKSVLTDSRIVGVRNDHMFCITPLSSCGMSQATQVREALQELKQKLQGKKDVFLYFYFSGHSDQNGNLLCSSENDLLTEDELKEHLSHLTVNEFLIILDCCYADGKITSEHIKDESFLVHKSLEPAELESKQHPLESLYSNLQKTGSHEDSVVPCNKPSSNVTDELPGTDFDTLDGAVFNKAPLVSFTVRQWSSSLSQQESYARAKGNSFLTQYIICGLRGAHECPFTICAPCERFKAKAKSLGYISAANLEDFISNHVEKAASRAGGRRQTPRMRTVHSKETILAYYSDEKLHDEIVFRSTSGVTERITIDKFPFTLLEFRKLLYSKVQGHLPICAQPKHIQILCDDQEIDATSYVDLQEFLRQGYDVRCQLRPCSGVVNGPVVVEIQNYKDQIITLLTSLQLTRKEQDLDTFEMDTSQKTCTAEDIRECCEEHPTLNDVKETSVASSVIVILTEASLYLGNLEICVFDDSLDCCFTKALN